MLAPLVAALCLVAAAPSRTAIVGVTVVDVEAGALLPNRTVVVEGDRIVAIEPHAAAPDGATVVSGEKLFLLPGLFDSHVHLFDPSTFGPLMVANGVTAARDMGGLLDTVLENRAKFASGAIVGPELFVTGPLLDGSPATWPITEICDDPETGRAAVRRFAERGVDQIKVYSRLSKETHAAICDEAKKAGKKPVGHIPEAVTIRESLAAGQMSNEHLLAFGPEIARLAGRELAGKHDGLSGFGDWASYASVDRGKLDELLAAVRAADQHQCPTLVVLDRLARLDDPAVTGDPLLRYVPPSIRDFWTSGRYSALSHVKKVLPSMRSFVGDLHRAGVPVLAGTDLGNPYVVAGFGLQDELRFLADSGLGAVGALRAATIVPAKFLGVADRLGSVAVGKTASFSLVRGNPLADVANAREVEGVFLRGKHFDRKALDAMLAEVEAKVAAASAPVAADAAAPAAPELDLPGEVVAKGRFRIRFSGRDSGTEDYLVTRDAGGFRVAARSTPQGGFDEPSLTTLRLDAERRLVSGEHRKLAGDKTSATYSVEGGELRAEARQGDAALPVRKLRVPEGALFGGPVYVTDFVTLATCGLAPGEKREFRLVSFGFPTWEPTDSKYVLERKPDETVKLGSGAPVPARVYGAKLESKMGVLDFTTWVDETFVPLRSTISFAFGKLEIEREAP